MSQRQRSIIIVVDLDIYIYKYSSIYICTVYSIYSWCGIGGHSLGTLIIRQRSLGSGHGPGTEQSEIAIMLMKLAQAYLIDNVCWLAQKAYAQASEESRRRGPTTGPQRVYGVCRFSIVYK